ncbi:MAG: FAD-dependent oxidoreductase [Bryobacteraceae bacterium]
MRTVIVVLLAFAPLACAETFDVVVAGGTPGGIAAAVAAARLGRTVALVEYHKHLGGMTASGLGKSDVETRAAIGGLFREFAGRVFEHYVRTYGRDHENVKQCRNGYFFEPSVAERVFDEMVRNEGRLRVFRYHQLEKASRDGNKVTSIRVKDRATGGMRDFRARVFIDSTYEGDLTAAAGAEVRVGRESRADFNELNAGVVYQDYETRTFLTGTTGEGDRRLQAYTFRLCLSSNPANQYVLRAPPPGYDRTRYLGYLEDVAAGRMAAPKTMKPDRGYLARTFNTAVRALSIAEIPNRKSDVNMNPRPLGFVFAEENAGYAEAGWEQREKITERIRNLTLGLLYFLQNDPAIPEPHRQLANEYHLAKDEFTDNGHFPWQLYVREGRRLVGEYTLTENDVILGPELGRTRIHRDSIAAGEFPIDSFPTRKRERGHTVALEGYILMLDEFTHPYQIPYRILIPKQVDGLIVPVAASATHIAFSTIRLEPTWMALGQAAGVAAHLAIEGGVELRNVPVERLQRLLLSQGQVLTYFKDIDTRDPAHAALQYFGARGFFRDYYARPKEPLEATAAAEWLRLALGKEAPLAATTSAALSESLERAGKRPTFGRSPQPLTRGEFCRLLYETLAH